MAGISVGGSTRGNGGGASADASPRWQPGVSEQLDIAELHATTVSVEARVPIRETDDIVKAREAGLSVAQNLGFANGQTTLVATAISELARNIILYAQFGEIVISRLVNGSHRTVVVVATDSGPGIANIQDALAGGFSTSGGLGLGLSGLKHLVDQLDIESQPGVGTQVTVRISSGGLISNPHNGIQG